jgi:branched-chain amino acid transport system substrate-binding protein
MESVEYYSELVDAQIKYTPDNHQGANDITISVVENGLWKLVSRQ